MKCSCRSLLVVALVLPLAVYGCGRRGKTQIGDDWIDFVHREGNFKVRMPKRPNNSLSKDGKEKRFRAQYQGGEHLVQVSYQKNADVGVSLQDRLAAVINLSSVQKSTKPTKFTAGNVTGYEAKYDLKSGRTVVRMRHRIFYHDGTMYQLLAAAPKDEFNNADTDRFFSSFQLTSE